MPEQLQTKTILEQAQAQVIASVQPLEDGDKAAVAVTSDQNTVIRAGGSVDMGKGFTAGGHVEKKRSSGWSWFAGVTKRWKRK